jgi:hypothetical protein
MLNYQKVSGMIMNELFVGGPTFKILENVREVIVPKLYDEIRRQL